MWIFQKKLRQAVYIVKEVLFTVSCNCYLIWVGVLIGSTRALFILVAVVSTFWSLLTCAQMLRYEFFFFEVKDLNSLF